MKKTILAAALICAMALGLTACGGGGSSEGSAAASSAAASSAAASSAAASSASAEAAAPAGETYDVGEFTVTVPEGWMASPQSDIMADADEDGNYPISTKQIGLIKGREDDLDAFSKPTIYIYMYDGDASNQADFAKSFYDETSDIDVSINGTPCIAFEAKSASFSDEEKFYVYDIVYYQISDEKHIQFTIPVDMIDYQGVSIDDADVQTILQGVALK